MSAAGGPYLNVGQTEGPPLPFAVEVTGNAKALPQPRTRIGRTPREETEYPPENATYRELDDEEYEKIRPPVPGRAPAPTRAEEGETSEHVSYRRIAALREEGTGSLFGSPKANRKEAKSTATKPGQKPAASVAGPRII